LSGVFPGIERRTLEKDLDEFLAEVQKHSLVNSVE
jgi:hypothetical protein